MSSSPQIQNPATPILIVDDNVQYANLLRRILESAFGYNNITMRESTDEAYEMLSAEPERFQLLFVDFRFPSGQNGAEFLRRLKDEDRLKKVVSFLITSEPSSENVAKARGAGAAGVISKPFDREALRSQIERACRATMADDQEYF